MEADPKLAALLKEYKQYFSIDKPSGKVKCEINGHCFPPKFDAVAAFIHGKSFPKLRKRFDAEQSLDQFKPLIIQSKNFPLMLYCTLTGQLMDKSLAAAKKHMEGKKYTSNKDKYDEGKFELKPEPDIDEILEELVPEGEDEDEDAEMEVAEEMEIGEEGEGEEEEGMEEDGEEAGWGSGMAVGGDSEDSGADFAFDEDEEDGKDGGGASDKKTGKSKSGKPEGKPAAATTKAATKAQAGGGGRKSGPPGSDKHSHQASNGSGSKKGASSAGGRAQKPGASGASGGKAQKPGPSGGTGSRAPSGRSEKGSSAGGGSAKRNVDRPSKSKKQKLR